MPQPPPGIIDSIDQQVPAGSFSSPVAGNVSGVITLAVAASDFDQVASVQFQIDGANIGGPDTVAPYSTTYDTRALLNGPHTFSAIIRDRVGNQTTTSVNVTFANAPIVVITAPGNGATLAGATSFTASVTSYDASVSTQFKIDGNNYGAAQPGTGSVGFGSVDTRSLLNGSRTFSVLTTDGHGNTATASVTVTIANAPLVSITSPANGATLSGAVAFSVNVTTYDASVSTQWKVDGINLGSPVAGAGAVGLGNIDTRSWLNGAHTISVVTTDGHGNSASASIAVTFNNVPTVAITSPGNGATLSGPFTFSANVGMYDSSVTTQFRIDGANVGAVQSGTGSKTPGALDSRSWLNGSHTLSVISSDNHGNQVTASITVTFNNAPVVAITAPGNGATVSGGTSISASITSYSQSVTTQFKIDGANYAAPQGGTSPSVNPDSRNWLNGWHTYSAQVTDSQSNTVTVSISVYHRNAPVVAITTPGDGTTVYNNINFRANVTIYDASATVRYYLGGSLWMESGAVGNNVGYDNLDTHYWNPGWFELKVITTDASGNVGQSVINVYVGNSVPGGGWLGWGNLQSWWGGDDAGWYSLRTSPPDYDNRWSGSLDWDTGGPPSWWTAFGEGAGAYPARYLPGNPDPTHYQMRLQMYISDVVEGGTDHNRIYMAVAVSGIGELVFYDQGPNWGWSGLWNVNGGESLQLLRWCLATGWNTSFVRGLNAYYDFVLKPGYNS